MQIGAPLWSFTFLLYSPFFNFSFLIPKFSFHFHPSCCQSSIFVVQAMGKGTLSSAEDTDTDVEDMVYNEPLIESRKIEQMMESVYWGDSEDDVKMIKVDEKESETFDSGFDNASLWQCCRFFFL